MFPKAPLRLPTLTQDWYRNAVAWGYNNGIITGLSETLFGPDDDLTREQLASILFRYTQYKGYDLSYSAADIETYSDFESVSEYADDAMMWAVSHNIITGITETTLQPQSSATRAQVAQMVMCFFTLFEA